MSGLIAGGMLSGLGQGIAQFGATMSALERERERLEEARLIKREELAARLADKASDRESRLLQKEMEIEGRMANTQAAGAAEPFADPARRRGGARDPHQGRVGGIGGGSVHSGFLNLKVILSLSPISSYFDRSKVGFGGEPRGAVNPMGGRVSTPNG